MNAPKELTSTTTPTGDITNWFETVGRPILLEALGNTYDRINSNFKTDFESYSQDKASLVAEIETLRPLASQVRRLEGENAALKDEIKALGDASGERIGARSHTDLETEHRTPSANNSTNQTSPERTATGDGDGDGDVDDNVEALTVPELKAEFSRSKEALRRLKRNNDKLYDRLLDTQAALHKSNELARKQMNLAKQWVNQATQLEAQSLQRGRIIKKLEAKLAAIPPASLNLSFSSDTGDEEVAADPTTLAPIQFGQAEQPGREGQLLLATPQQQQKTLFNATHNRKAGPRSQSRDMVGLDRRCLTPQQHAHHVQEIDETPPCLPPLPTSRDAAEEPLKVKPEPSSDTPVVVSERCVRKRKIADRDGSRITPSTRIKLEHSPEPRSASERRRFAPHESMDFDTELRTVETPRKHARYQHDTRTARYIGDIEGAIQPSTNHIGSKDKVPAIRAGVQANTGPALQPLNNNQILRPKSNLASVSRDKRAPTRLHGIASLAEDGYQNENLDPSYSKGILKVGALDQLLNTPSPATKAVRSELLVEDTQSSNSYFDPPIRRELPFDKDGRGSWDLAPKEDVNNASHRPASSSVEQNYNKAASVAKAKRGKIGAPTLRQLPKEQIRLEDFKINPDANGGYDYAFTDVVRRKEDRACLQGCVQENCCGHKFRALAHSYRPGIRPHEFQTLLESYLGDDCHRLSTMSKEEKETLWVEAKIRELANAAGKHRHRFARMTTPPGFWRADFPSTQEGAEYSKEAAEQEQEVIEQRYREAMRPGGVWMFRDE